jgi:electron transport complex protein RnfC
MEKAAEVLEGLHIAAAILEPARTVIAIEASNRESMLAMQKAAADIRMEVEFVSLRTKYPQGDEKQLIKTVTGREVPSAGLPLDIGCMVSNAATLFAIFEAVVYDKPVIERVVTVGGGAIRHPANLKTRIGTTFTDLILECGGFMKIPDKIISGGPMMGFTVFDLDTPVTKASSGLLCLTAREVRESRQTACLNCGRCIRSCPMGLHPTDLFKFIDHSEIGRAVDEGLLDCRECGCCGFICPAHIPLVQGMRVGKSLSLRAKTKETA